MSTNLFQRISESLGEVWTAARWYGRQMWQQFFAHNCLNAAAALTFTTLFAVVPMMTVTYTFFSLIPEYSSVGEKVETFVFKNFVPGSSDLVQEKLAEFADRARNLTATGFAFLFVVAFMMLVTIEKTFNTIWQVAEPRKGVPRLLLYWAVLSLGPACVVAGILSSVYLLSASLVSEYDTLGVSQLLLGYLPVILTVTGFTVLYYAVPNCHVPFRHAFLGGVLTMAVFQGAFNAFAGISRGFTYDAIYGTFAAVPVFLVWLNLVWIIVLAGAIFVRCLELPRDDHPSTEPLMIKTVRVLGLFHDAHARGAAVTDKEINELVKMSTAEHERVFGFFAEQRLLMQTEDERWVLGRNLRGVTLWDLYQRFPDGLDLERLREVKDLPQVVEPLKAMTQFGSNEMSVTLDSVFTA